MHKFQDMECLNSALNTGAFLSSGGNIMVASWGFIGVMWGKKVFIAPVRESRYTKRFIDETGEFTISIPFEGTMKEALALCGSRSGREHDKWAEAQLVALPAKSAGGAVVEGCRKYLECRVIGVLPMDGMDISAFGKWYPTGDKHVFYFGEIVEEY